MERMVIALLPDPEKGEPVQHYLDGLLNLASSPASPLQRQLVHTYGLSKIIVETSRIALLGHGDREKIDEVFEPNSVEFARSRFSSLMSPDTPKELDDAQQPKPQRPTSMDEIVSNIKLTGEFAEEAIANLNNTMSELNLSSQNIRARIGTEIDNYLRSDLKTPLWRLKIIIATLLYGKQQAQEIIETSIREATAESLKEIPPFEEDRAVELIKQMVQKTGKTEAKIRDFSNLSLMMLSLLQIHGVSPLVIAAATEVAIENYYNPQPQDSEKE